MRNMTTLYKFISVDSLDELGKSVLSGRMTREDYRTVVAMIAGGLQHHRHYPDVVLEMLYARAGVVTAFDMNMLRTCINKHQDTFRPVCRNMESWIELFVCYPEVLSRYSVGAERERRRSEWKNRIADYHARRRAGRDGVADE